MPRFQWPLLFFLIILTYFPTEDIGFVVLYCVRRIVDEEESIVSPRIRKM